MKPLLISLAFCGLIYGQAAQPGGGGGGGGATGPTGATGPQGPGVVTVTTITASTVTFSGGGQIVVNANATPSTAIVATLPTASAGARYCIANSSNVTPAPTTGTLKIQTSASGQLIIFSDGTVSASGGYVISGGAAGDFGCVFGVDSTHWQFTPAPSGTWVLH
jgi:hypothetical protein